MAAWGTCCRGDSQQAFAQRITPLLEPHRDTRDFLYRERFATRPPLEAIFDGSSTRKAQRDAAYDAFGQHTYTLREIGALVGRAPATVWTWIKSAEKRRIEATEANRGRSSACSSSSPA